MGILDKLTVTILFIYSVSLTNCQGQTPSRPVIQEVKQETSPLVAPPETTDPLFFLEGQLCQHLRKIHQDQEGNLWFGTNVYGVMKFNGDSLVYLQDVPGLGAGRITGIVEDSIGNLWFGTYEGLTKYDGTTFTNFDKTDGLPDSEVWAVTLDRQGRIWVGTTQGVCVYDGKSFTAFKLPRPPVESPEPIYWGNRIVSIVEAASGYLWFGTDGYGIVGFDGENFSTYTTTEGLAGNTVHELMVDSKGNLWIGTYFGGVSKYDGENFTNFTQAGRITGVEVCGFYEARNGDIWFAAENHGVYRYRDDTFTNFGEEQGLMTNGILTIFEDRQNRFWFGGWGGLFRLEAEAFVSVTKLGPWLE